MESKINFDSLIEWCPQAFVFANMEGIILFSNPAANKLYGYDNNELLGQNVDVFNSHLTHNTDEIINDIKEHGFWSGELIQRKKDDIHFDAELTVNLVFENGAPTGICSYSRDITDKKEADKKVLEHRELLAMNSRLSAIGEMAAGIAHELNNPLAIISNKVQLLAKMQSKDKLQPEKLETELNELNDTCKRISKIITGLKSISRDNEKDPMIPVSMKQTIEDALILCQERFKINEINLSIDLDIDEKIMVSGKAAQLSQVFLNLLNNAFDAVVGSNNRSITIRSIQNKGRLLIEVENSGEPIKKDIRDKIMQPFFTTKEVGKGTGLGLSISKRIINDHGGKFTLKDSDQTCFVISLEIVR